MVIAATALTLLVLAVVSAVQLRYMRSDLIRLLSDQQYALVSRAAQELDANRAKLAELMGSIGR